MKKKLIVVFAVVVAVSFACSVHAQSIGVTLPSTPTAVTASVSVPSQINVSWTASTESSGTIADYYIYRNGTQIATTGGTFIIDSGLTSGLYMYTVVAVDQNGNMSAQSSPATATFVVDTTPPTTPTGITANGATSTNNPAAQTSVTISWTASTDNVGVAGYRLYRSGTLLTTSTAPYTGTSYTDNVAPGTYWYTVVAYDASGNSSNQSAQTSFSVNVYTAAPSVPTNVSVQQVSASGVAVSWTPSAGSVGIAGYQIYRDGIQVASTTGSPYTDSGLSNQIQYSYTVAAYDAAGNVSSQSWPVKIFTQTVNGPSIPFILSAIPGTSTIRLSWASVADNLLVTGYSVYRNGGQIATVSSTSYLDQKLASGTYAYSVSATDISGAVSPISSSTSATVPAAGAIQSPQPASATTNPPVATPGTASPGLSATFTQSLYFGLRNNQVKALQSVLVTNGYLAPVNATGFFGSLTQSALEKFQCDKNIVCTNGAGWGLVGPKTRNVLNGLGSDGANQTVTVSPATSASAAGIAAQIQALQNEIANLQHNAQTLSQ